MPLQSTRGAASARGFGFGGGASFIEATGGTIVDCGNFRTHIFTGPGTFTVSKAPATGTVEYLVVAGGAGGGMDRAGGGGAGGYRQNYPSPTTAGLPVTAQGYPITVGSGGASGTLPSPGPAPQVRGKSGNNSIFSTITSAGGGGGGSGNGGTDCAPRPGVAGGSGGGAGQGGSITGPGGAGNTPPVSPPQGNTGGVGSQPIGQNNSGGGGGGAGATGSNAPGSAGGAGGIGSPIATTFFGPTAPTYGTPGPAPGRFFAGGGGGGGCGIPGGTGGAGGGGNGGGSPGPGTAGTINTGGGGGGGTDTLTGGFAGGSGIIAIRYQFK